MKANIVIFGKNSIIAQNFINKDFCKKANIISISRSSELELIFVAILASYFYQKK